jgi:UDP:flavonoid glycosyltransferase YjiC (YdhE family)
MPGPRDRMRIAFLGVRVPGHLNPMTTLARILKARGRFDVFISVVDTEPYVCAAASVHPILRGGVSAGVGMPEGKILVGSEWSLAT